MRSLFQRNTVLREVLKRKEMEAKSNRERMIRSGRQTDMLSQQLRQRNAELHDLYREVLCMNERIALLERTFEESFPARNGPKDYSGFPQVSENVSSAGISYPNDTAKTMGDVVRMEEKGKPIRSREEPLWRKKLNTILDTLDDIEG